MYPIRPNIKNKNTKVMFSIQIIPGGHFFGIFILPLQKSSERIKTCDYLNAFPIWIPPFSAVFVQSENNGVIWFFKL